MTTITKASGTRLGDAILQFAQLATRFKQGQKEFQTLELQFNAAQVLARAAQSDTGVRLAEIGKAAVLSKWQISRVVRCLRAKKLVTIEIDTQDSRYRLLVITPKGRTALIKAEASLLSVNLALAEAPRTLDAVRVVPVKLTVDHLSLSNEIASPSSTSTGRKRKNRKPSRRDIYAEGKPPFVVLAEQIDLEKQIELEKQNKKP